MQTTSIVRKYQVDILLDTLAVYSSCIALERDESTHVEDIYLVEPSLAPA